MGYSTDAQSIDPQGNINSLAYNVAFVVGAVILTILFFATCWFRIRAERNSDSRHAQGCGISTATLSSFPQLRYSDAKLRRGGGELAIDLACSICLADYRESDLLRSLPHCGHMFHARCIDPWLRSHCTCPICRTAPIAGAETPIPEQDQQLPLGENAFPNKLIQSLIMN